ncbi:MAG: T9SS type A sorting domain-containing protein, partial [Cytophagales bacterium]|nr:T9SS type A sorting domain-containing protein [Cytophagales bacterium]
NPGNPTDTVEDWFVSPPLNFNTSARLNLKLYPGVLSADSSEYFGIWFGTGSNDPANGNFYELANLTDMHMQTNFQWVDTSFAINSYTDSGYVAFKYINTWDDKFEIYIDNVNIIPDSNKGTIDSLKIIPSNPTTNDSIKIISFTLFPYGACTLKNSSFNINNKEIVINATHFEGGWPAICNSVDTITIGKLDTGAYTLYYNLSVDTNLAVFDTDTLFFVVQNPTDVISTPVETTAIKIYPNPNTDEFIIEMNILKVQDVEITLFNIAGQVIYNENLKRFKGLYFKRINTKGLSTGVYQLQIKTGYGEVNKKVVVE